MNFIGCCTPQFENNFLAWVPSSDQCHSTYNHLSSRLFIAARKRNFRRLCFHRCLSIHRGMWQTPPGQTPPGWTPPRADTPWQSPPQADTPLGKHTPPGQTHTPWADTHPLGRHTPPGRTHTPWADTHTPGQNHTPGQTFPRADTPPSDTVNKRVVRILLECILVYKWNFVAGNPDHWLYQHWSERKLEWLDYETTVDLLTDTGLNIELEWETRPQTEVNRQYEF